MTYAYDQLNRLIQSSSTGTGVMNYAYDGFRESGADGRDGDDGGSADEPDDERRLLIRC